MGNGWNYGAYVNYADDRLKNGTSRILRLRSQMLIIFVQSIIFTINRIITGWRV